MDEQTIKQHVQQLDKREDKQSEDIQDTIESFGLTVEDMKRVLPMVQKEPAPEAKKLKRMTRLADRMMGLRK